MTVERARRRPALNPYLGECANSGLGQAERERIVVDACDGRACRPETAADACRGGSVYGGKREGPVLQGKGGRCIAAGVGTLVSAGVITQAAQGKLDYVPFGTNGAGLIRVTAGRLLYPAQSGHLAAPNEPELFAWCDNV